MRPEVLAPAGTKEAMRAAIRAGADAVYFGLQAFNARARAENFTLDDLPAVMAELHAHGVKGYVTLNILVFDEELLRLEETLRGIAQAGADAIIVQDLGVLRLAQAVAPQLPIHASTQMTCTDAASVQLAHSLGARRVVVARELSLQDIAAIRQQTDVELEVFVHGALCVSYSGQCLTSEAIGGRSANRGACAQACRLPYDLVVDGQVTDLGERAYLLSPMDLEASSLVPELAGLGVSSLKIEGRLKGPDYVASATRLYRAAVDAVDAVDAAVPAAPASHNLVQLRHDALLTYSRGSGSAFLAGTNHQILVEGRTCDHRGLAVGAIAAVEKQGRRHLLRLRLQEGLARGDGVLIEGRKAGAGEVGGRVWELFDEGTSVPSAEVGREVRVWLGPDVDVTRVRTGHRLFKNDDPVLDKQILQRIEREPHREAIDIAVTGGLGDPFVLQATSARGLFASVSGDACVAPATIRPLDDDTLRDKLGRLGDTPFVLRALHSELPAGATLPLSALNRARRSLCDALIASAQRSHPTTTTTAASLLSSLVLPSKPPPPGLFVLCRNEEQASAALQAGADGVYLDFLAMTGTSQALVRLRESGARFVGVAPPRIRKPGEEKIDRFLLGLAPDAVLVRGLGALYELSQASAQTMPAPLAIGDFSLNVTNRLTAAEVLGHGLSAFTPSFDLDAAQLSTLLSSVGAFAELVIHHPMPLFHMEHCVFAALLSEGRDFRSCGRPCERHQVSLRDRVGMDHPVEADVGCRNTVFHQRAQSAASLLAAAQDAGCGRFRIELVREGAAEVKTIVETYRAALDGALSPARVFAALHTEGGVGVVKGSLRILA